MNKLVLGLSLALLGMHPVSALADSIPGLFDTGVDEVGNVRPIGEEEIHYSISGQASQAFIRIPNPAYITAPPGSAWIGPSGTSVTDPDGVYSYVLVFDLTGFDPNTVRITANVASDNRARVFLNGIDVGFSNDSIQFYGFTPMLIDAATIPFNQGMNTLEFRVLNEKGATINPNGLLVNGLHGEADSLSGQSCGEKLLVCEDALSLIRLDSDGDGIENELDNCPWVANPDQRDSGGVASRNDRDGAIPNGVGDACERFDVTGDGRVNKDDVRALHRLIQRRDSR